MHFDLGAGNENIVFLFVAGEGKSVSFDFELGGDFEDVVAVDVVFFDHFTVV